VFEKYYKQHLAKRLLLDRSVSDDAERQMIGKLKRECGSNFTSKLEGMFKDMGLSKNVMEEYKKYLEVHSINSYNGNSSNNVASCNSSNNVNSNIELSVTVLTTGFWPTQAHPPCTLPADVLAESEMFKKFYLNNHSGRRLNFQTNMGTAEIRAFFVAKRHMLSVSTYQMCILLLYNGEKTKFTFDEIKKASQIPIMDLKRQLMSLSLGKYKILKKEPFAKEFKDTDTYAFNSKFKSNLFRIRVVAVSAQKESKEQTVKTRGKVDEDRKHQVEAAIVRIMKSRRKLSHNELIAEVTKQLQQRFLPSPVLIKKRIESLIEREYLERSAEQRSTYMYCA